MPVLTHAEYKKIDTRVTWITWGANFFGAFITQLYMSVVEPIPQGASPVVTMPLWGLVISIAAIVFLLFVGGWIGGLASRHFPKWVDRLLDGAPADEAPVEARREALNYPALVALTSLAMWCLAGLVFSLLLVGAWQAFVVVVFVGGVVTSAVVYFAVGAIWRPVVWLFFPDGRMDAWRNSVKWRLVLAFVLVGLYPAVILSATAMGRAQALLNSQNPQVVLQNLYIAVGAISLIAALAGLALSVLVSHSIVDPLRRLQAAMSRVAQNDLDVKMLADSNDELGYAAQGFNEMVAGLRRAETLRNLLNLYVSPQVARQALEHGASLGGQLVECSILFSDIRGFTSLSETLSPEALITLLNRYMSRMVDVVIANGGMVNKFGGDSLLAIFGTPLNQAEDHAACAVRTALQMNESLADFNLEQEKTGAPTLKIGIGIATGPAVAGNVGGQGRIEYTVIGDTVNLAARLQDLTKQAGHGILVSASVVEQAARFIPFTAEALEPIAVRGKAEPVKVYGVAAGPTDR